MLAAWFTFAGLLLVGYTLFYAGLDEIGKWVLISGMAITLLALPTAIWTFAHGRTDLAVSADWSNNRLSMVSNGHESTIQSPDKIESFMVGRTSGDIDPSVTIMTAATGTPVMMREEYWFVEAIYKSSFSKPRRICNCINKREGEKIARMLNQTITQRAV